MFRFLLKISFDGTDFHGWQVQDNAPTVQQCLCEKLSLMLKTSINVTGCSRTDAGVHANEFYCHFDSPLNLEPKAFVNGLNSVLPETIAILACHKVDDDFHARYNAKGKNYIYLFSFRVWSSRFCFIFMLFIIFRARHNNIISNDIFSASSMPLNVFLFILRQFLHHT